MLNEADKVLCDKNIYEDILAQSRPWIKCTSVYNYACTHSVVLENEKQSGFQLLFQCSLA
jgi:hypothetical protein